MNPQQTHSPGPQQQGRETRLSKILWAIECFAEDSPTCVFMWAAFWPIREFHQAIKHLTVIGKILIYPIVMMFAVMLTIPFAGFALLILPIELFVLIGIGIALLLRPIFIKKTNQ